MKDHIVRNAVHMCNCLHYLPGELPVSVKNLEPSHEIITDNSTNTPHTASNMLDAFTVVLSEER